MYPLSYFFLHPFLSSPFTLPALLTLSYPFHLLHSSSHICSFPLSFSASSPFLSTPYFSPPSHSFLLFLHVSCLLPPFLSWFLHYLYHFAGPHSPPSIFNPLSHLLIHPQLPLFPHPTLHGLLASLMFLLHSSVSFCLASSFLLCSFPIWFYASSPLLPLHLPFLIFIQAAHSLFFPSSLPSMSPSILLPLSTTIFSFLHCLLLSHLFFFPPPSLCMCFSASFPPWLPCFLPPLFTFPCSYILSFLHLSPSVFHVPFLLLSASSPPFLPLIPSASFSPSWISSVLPAFALVPPSVFPRPRLRSIRNLWSVQRDKSAVFGGLMKIHLMVFHVSGQVVLIRNISIG